MSLVAPEHLRPPWSWKNITLYTQFQPIVCVRRQYIAGVEALSRGCIDEGRSISPTTLFRQAAQPDAQVELDRLCYTSALATFAPLYTAQPTLILFLNLTMPSLTRGEATLASLLEVMGLLGIAPPNVAIEISESFIRDLNGLYTNIQLYRQHGFLLALDDVGKGFSNLDRIGRLYPDILKADRTLIQDIHQDYHRQEVLRSLINLSEKIGGWLIAEGVESQAEAITALELGADLFQGFYFAPPQSLQDNMLPYSPAIALEETGRYFKQAVLRDLTHTNLQTLRRRHILKEVAQALTSAALPFEGDLHQLLAHYPQVEAAYVLDEHGTQITDPIYRPTDFKPQKTRIVQPSVRGTTHQFQEYFYILMETDTDPFESSPYVPLPSGHLCVMLSTIFPYNERELVLCLIMRFGEVGAFHTL